jgi:hypothetical protein
MDPRRDIQVLAPMHRGSARAGNLNRPTLTCLLHTRK